MLNSLWDFLRRKPSTLALAMATGFAGANLFLLARTYQTTRTGLELTMQAAPLKASLAELQRAKEEGFATLREDISSAAAELNALKSSFPHVGSPFDLYRRGMALAQSNRIEIDSVERGSTTIDDTSMGQLTRTTYTLQARGSLQRCLTFISQLEDEGLGTVAVDTIQIDPVGQACSFNVMIAGRTSAELPQVPR